MSTASKAATTPVNDRKIGSQMEDSATAGAGDSPFELSLWGDFFVTYTPPISQGSEEWKRERADQLRREVCGMFDAGNAMSPANTLMLVDALERLGIDRHFQTEIYKALCRARSEELQVDNTDTGLHIVALRFRLLRQHGFFVSTDVFDKYRDGTGTFSTALTDDPRGLLSLYNAAHMAVPGENVLDDVIAFTRSHLKAMKGNVGSPLAEQISRALDIPLPRYMRPLETMHYIAEYVKEETHNAVVLELARLEYDITRSIQLKELRAFCLWFRDLYENVKLTYARDRSVELYFWSFGMLQGEENSHARIIFSKILVLISLMDDTYDVYATFDDCKNFYQATQRWDESAVSMLPEYLRVFYIRTLRIFNEFEDDLEPDQRYRVPYVKKEYILLSKYYLEEVKWCNKNYIPSFKEQVELSSMSSAAPVLTLAALMGAVGKEATKEAFEWASCVPDMVRACGEVGRFLNDISAYKKGRKNKNDVTSSLECYMKEHGTTGEEAAVALTAMVDHAWRRINQACMEIDKKLLPAVKLAVINQARMCEIVYCGGNDAYTFCGDLEGLVTSLFVKPIPI